MIGMILCLITSLDEETVRQQLVLMLGEFQPQWQHHTVLAGLNQSLVEVQ